MGAGDEIMVAGYAREAQARDPRPVAVHGRRGVHWHAVYDHNPRMVRDAAPGDPAVQWLAMGSGSRPWVDVLPDRFVHRPHRPPRGEIYFTAAEQAWAARLWGILPRAAVLVHASAGKLRKTRNMDWGAVRWQRLADRLAARGVAVVELASPNQDRLKRTAGAIVAPDFRHAAAALAGARLVVLPEGGIMHAAAAVGVRAVALYGGFISPAQSGYDGNVEIFAGGEPCGSRHPCAHCRGAWESIDPDRVAQLTEDALTETTPPAAAPGGTADGLIEYRGIWLPAHETHLQGWMEARMRSHPDELLDGRPTYQRHKLRAALEHVPADRRFVAVDVGAHCGLWSMQLAREFQVVWAFEPVPLHRRAFDRNLEAARAAGADVVLFAVALGAAAGRCAIRTTPGSSGDSWPVAGDDVAVAPLDAFELGRPDLVKIDCEGYELNVLKGAEGMIATARPVIVVEQKPGKGQQHGLGERDAVDWLVARGYRVAREISGDFVMVPEGAR